MVTLCPGGITFCVHVFVFIFANVRKVFLQLVSVFTLTF